MMRMMANKKNVKIVSIIVAAVFIIGVAGLAYMQMNTPAMAAPSSSVGVVDASKVITPDNPLLQNARAELQQYAADMQAKFEKDSANMSDAEKQKLFFSMQQQLQEKQLAVQKSIEDKIESASKSVADAKGLKVVLKKEAVLYGGVDITPLVSKKLAEDAAKTPAKAEAKGDQKAEPAKDDKDAKK